MGFEPPSYLRTQVYLRYLSVYASSMLEYLHIPTLDIQQ